MFGDYDEKKKQYLKDIVKNVVHLREASMTKFIEYEKDEKVANLNVTEVQHKVSKI